MEANRKVPKRQGEVKFTSSGALQGGGRRQKRPPDTCAIHRQKSCAVSATSENWSGKGGPEGNFGRGKTRMSVGGSCNAAKDEMICPDCNASGISLGPGRLPERHSGYLVNPGILPESYITDNSPFHADRYRNEAVDGGLVPFHIGPWY